MRAQRGLFMVVLIGLAYPVTAAQAVRLTGTAYAEGGGRRVTVAVWRLQAPPAGREALFRALPAAETAAGESFAVDVPASALPVAVELSAPGCVTVRRVVRVPEEAALESAWLRRGVESTLTVTGGQKKGEKILVRGSILLGGWSQAADRWLPAVPTMVLEKEKQRRVLLPEGKSRVVLGAIDGEGRWGRSSKTAEGGNAVRVELEASQVAVRVRDRRGRPVAGAVVTAFDAPEGAAAVTDEKGEVRLWLETSRGWRLIAVGDDDAGMVSGREAPKGTVEVSATPIAPLRLTSRDRTHVMLANCRWLGAHPRAWAVVRGGEATVPFLGEGGSVWVRGPGLAPRVVSAHGSATVLPLNPPAGAVVRGRVVGPGGEPAAGVPVWVTLPPWWQVARGASMSGMPRIPLARPWLPWAVTGADGRFDLRRLPAGRATVEARAPDAPPATAELRLQPGTTSEITLKLERGAHLSVRLTDPDGVPVAGGSVKVFSVKQRRAGVFMFGGARTDEPRDPLAQGVTGAEGRVRIADVPVGTVTVEADAPGFVGRKIDDVKVPAEGLDLGEVELERGVTLEGTVVDEKGRPVGGAEVMLSDQPEIPWFRSSATADEEGKFSFPDLSPAGEVYLQARAKGFVPEPPLKVVMPPEGPVSLAMAPERVLEGRVTDAATGAPVAEARIGLGVLRKITLAGGVQASTASSVGGTSSGEDGTFRAGGLSPGSVELSVEAKGYRGLDRTVEIPAEGRPEPQLLELEKGLELRGRVTTAEGAPAIGVAVSAQPATERLQARFSTYQDGRTAADGTFVLQGFAPGSYRVSATADDGASARAVIEVPAEREIVLTLKVQRTISGRVLDPDGAPVSDAEVMGYSDGNGLQATSDADGGYRLEGALPGGYYLMARAEGFAAATRKVTVEDDTDAEVDFHLEPGGVVTGTVTGLSRAELARCQVTVRMAGAIPSANGRFRVDSVKPGRRQVTAAVMPGNRSHSVVVEVPAGGEPVDVEIDFSAGLTLTGTVRRSGEPVGGVHVAAATPGGGTGGATVTDVEGAFSIGGLEPGENEIRVDSAAGKTLLIRREILEDDAYLELELPSGAISGRVSAKQTGSPVEGAWVKVVPAGGGIERQTGSGADGRFMVDEVPDGRYVVEAGAAGFSSARSEVEVSGGTAARLELALDPENSLVLVLGGFSGPPPSTVTIVPAMGGIASTTISNPCDAEARCPLSGLAPGRWTLLVLSLGGGALVAVDVPSEEVPIALRPLGKLRVIGSPGPNGAVWRVRVVAAESGLAVPWSRYNNPTGGEWVPVRTTGAGASLPRGRYRLELIAPDGSRTARDIEVPQGDTPVIVDLD